MIRRRLALGVLVVVELAAVAALIHLHPLPHPAGGLGTWITGRSLEQVLAGAVLAALLILVGWLALITLLYVAAVAGRAPRAAAHLSRLVLPAVRRLVDAALVVSLAAMPPALAADDGPMVPAPAGLVGVHPGPLGWIGTPSPLLPQEHSGPPLPPGDARLATPRFDDHEVVHVVSPGDNLWTIAAAHLRAVESDPGDARIAAYWRAVIAANRDHLRSGDPDLIHPGELVVLPPPAP